MKRLRDMDAKWLRVMVWLSNRERLSLERERPTPNLLGIGQGNIVNDEYTLHSSDFRASQTGGPYPAIGKVVRNDL